MASARNDPCPCGSGRKYKNCCGSLMRAPGSGATVSGRLTRAVELLRQGFVAHAERELRAVLAADPAHPDATHFLGVAMCRMGRWDEGLARMRRSIELAPESVDFEQNTGLMLAEAGKLEDAERLFEGLIVAHPDLASAHEYLGMVRRRRGFIGEAIACYEKAIALAPQSDSPRNSLGLAYFEKGNVEAALAQYHRAILLNPRNATAHVNLGNALKSRGEPQQAIASYRRAAEIDPSLTVAHYHAGRLLLGEGDAADALSCFRAAVRAAPAERDCWQGLADALSLLRFDAPDAQAEADLTACLANGAIDRSRLGSAAFSLLCADPGFDRVVRTAPEPDARRSATPLVASIAALARPMALALLENTLVRDPGFERFLTWLRGALLGAWRVGALAPDPRNEAVVCALAQQCFLNGYLFVESKAQATGVVALRAKVASGKVGKGASFRLEIALLGCYRALRNMPGAREVRSNQDSPFGRLVRRQIAAPLRDS